MLINDASITGSLTVNSNSTFNGTHAITGSLQISGSNTLIGTKTITGSVFISGSKTIIGNNIITGSLIVTAGITGSISATNGIISGSSQLTSSTLAITGSNIFRGDQTISGSLSVTGSITSKGNATIGTGSGAEGGQIDLATAQTGNTSLTGSTISLDVYGDRIRIFENAGNNRGAYLNVASQSSTVGSTIVTSPNLASIQTLTSASYAALTPASGTLYIIIG